jgi:hypothetical protein
MKKGDTIQFQGSDILDLSQNQRKNQGETTEAEILEMVSTIREIRLTVKIANQDGKITIQEWIVIGRKIVQATNLSLFKRGLAWLKGWYKK